MARAARIARGALGWVTLSVGLFMLAGWIGSSIARNTDWREPADGVEIMVLTNGVHTALILPARTRWRDWHRDFPPAHVNASARPYTHVAVSWGEREVFLNTPTWADLSPLTVLRILGIGGEGLLHVEHYVRPGANDYTRPVRLSAAQYRKLVAQIALSLPPRGSSYYPGYDAHDVFYESSGRYTFTRTCNQWTSDALAAAGVRVGRWTPFASGVTKWFPAGRRTL